MMSKITFNCSTSIVSIDLYNYSYKYIAYLLNENK